jgi:hypothetical protein
MIALIWFVLAVLASPFKSKSRLEAENAVLRHQLIVLRRVQALLTVKSRSEIPRLTVAGRRPSAWSQRPGSLLSEDQC